MRKITIFLLILLLSFTVMGNEKYSYEKAEELTPLINWNGYSPKAFDKAIKENKPIFLLLTAPSWCYWCQVYESEDYLFHPKIIKIINENFIPIYVDADKRQDLTRQYLEGGWPSTTIFTPNRERLYGFSGVRPIENMLANLNEAINYVDNNGFSSSFSYNYIKKIPKIPNKSDLNNIKKNYIKYILQAYDPIYGGFGTGQKFPQALTLNYLLENYELNNSDKISENKLYLEIVENTLKNQYTKIGELKSNYKLFDPVEGGFHRYGTTKEWTPPHYEKMLYDNVKLLKTYTHLSYINPKNLIAKEVNKKTNSYILKYYYDDLNGGFYANTDVHGEDKYYSNKNRSNEKPRIEKTKFANWNSQAISSYLYLLDQSNINNNFTNNINDANDANDSKLTYKKISIKSLDFLEKEMFDKNGAYHYLSPNNKKEVQGSLIDNSYLLLVFIEAYEILNDEKYLEIAKEIAKYSIDNLYDWNSGGFFERNSLNKELYAPGENILLTKPLEENGIISYALLKLYKQTNDSIYLNSAIKSLGNKLENLIGLDNIYYYVKSSEFILENNLLDDFKTRENEIKIIEKEKQSIFWLNKILNTNTDTNSDNDITSKNNSNKNNSNREFRQLETGLDKLTGSIIILFLISIIAGFLSFASPCSLPILPAYLAYTLKSSQKNIIGMTIFFFLGLSSIFVILGMTASILGNFLKSHITIFSQITGLLILLFAILLLLGKNLPGLNLIGNKPKSYLGSILFGMILGLSWTPCVGPILISILILASTTSSAFIGGILLFFYSIGLALPLVIFSRYISKIDKNSKLGKFGKLIKGKELKFKFFKKELIIHTTSLITALILIILAYLIYSGSFIHLINISLQVIYKLGYLNLKKNYY